MDTMRRGSLAALSVAAVVLAGCSTIGGKASSGGVREAKDVKDVTIGFSQRQLDAPYFAAMVDVAEKKARKEGFHLEVQNADGDAVTQLNQAQTLVAQGIDVLVADAMSPKTQQVQLKDVAGEVPLVFVDTGIEGVGVTSVSSDNYAIGKLSGRLAAKRFHRGKTISLAILNGGPDDEIVGPDRQRGFLDGLRAGGVKYHLVARTPANYSQDAAVPATESILAAHRNVDLIVGLNDSMTLGALSTLRDKGNEKTLVAAAADGQKQALQEIKSGGCDGRYISTGLNSPALAADRAFDIALQIGTGKAAPKSFKKQEYTRAAGINCKNVDKFYDPRSVF
ncbi:sugar ABC transporter substrate-binding protein [Streptomyces iranensis]|uniref:ABC-type transporter, integral membrane subunit n=1 Tax=Streptomyces iranensis TaxID=576784 RepID=A0A061ABQ8_9ACTN|nr:substrate-binding domain-containing protein [Streptomyces iranensis]MBP2063525.1 ribose transport system substrate-binding protein [Streptomyces iranensis]CDR17896.1 ABC-type transporter, integral membrane subunit [Streptomyces iranensis]